MADKKFAHRGATGGRGEMQHAGSERNFYLHYIIFPTRAQSPFYRAGMRLAVLLADMADALAGAVWRWSIEA